MNGAEIMKYVVERASEPSTWRGAFFLLTAFGVTIQPELQDAILAAGLGLAGLVGVLTRDQAS
jgi:hypothetical protein